MCIVSLKGGKIDHTVGGLNQFSFQNEYTCMMIVPAETWPIAKVKIVKICAFVHRNLMIREGC